MFSPGDCEYLNQQFRKVLHPRQLSSHQFSRGSTCNHILIEERRYASIAQQQIIYVSTKWRLWAEFKSVLKGSAVTLKLDYVIPLLLPSCKLGKHAVAFLPS